MEPAIELTTMADIFCVVGTSLAVYPAASLLYYAPNSAKIYLIDPNPPDSMSDNIIVIKDKAAAGVAEFIKMI
jgi:NAD-dependent deacetylase